MAAARSVLRATAARVVSPGETLEQVNELLCPDIPEKMFVTCLYGVIDPASGGFASRTRATTFRSRAPHGGAVELRATGMPLGLLPGMRLRGEGGGDRARRGAPPLLRRCHRGALPDREMYGTPRLASSSPARRS